MVLAIAIEEGRPQPPGIAPAFGDPEAARKLRTEVALLQPEALLEGRELKEGALAKGKAGLEAANNRAPAAGTKTGVLRGTEVAIAMRHGPSKGAVVFAPATAAAVASEAPGPETRGLPGERGPTPSMSTGNPRSRFRIPRRRKASRRSPRRLGSPRQCVRQFGVPPGEESQSRRGKLAVKGQQCSLCHRHQVLGPQRLRFRAAQVLPALRSREQDTVAVPARSPRCSRFRRFRSKSQLGRAQVQIGRNSVEFDVPGERAPPGVDRGLHCHVVGVRRTMAPGLLSEKRA